MSNMEQFVMLDRDGVVAVNRPDFTKSTDEALLMPFVAEAVAKLHSLGIGILIYHHEKGVAAGALDSATVSTINNHIIQLIDEYVEPKVIKAIVSTDTPITEEMPEVKIKAGLLLRAAQQNSVDLRKTWIIGDEEADMEAAWLVGARTCLVRTGRGHIATRVYGHKPADARKPDVMAKDVFSAINRIFA